MSKRASISAVFIGEVKKHFKEITVPKTHLKTPNGFYPKIKFLTKIKLNSKGRSDLCKYVENLKTKYDNLVLDIKKPDKSKIFIRFEYKNLSTMRIAILEIQSNIRALEIINYDREFWKIILNSNP